MTDTRTIQTPRCWKCGENGWLTLPSSGIDKYEAGAFIQDAFPELPAPIREQIMTGIHPECWKTMFGDEPLGVVTDDGVICLVCGQFSNGDDATREGYPDGFTCAECGEVID